jgi:hypothetical protein
VSARVLPFPGSGELMGLYAAKRAVLKAAELELGNLAARLFVHMALECWDDEDNPGRQAPRQYFGRRELSAIALGFLAPDNGTDRAYQAVKRATRELIEKGAIVRVRHGGANRTAVYELQVTSDRPRLRAVDPIPLRTPVEDDDTGRALGVSF